MKRVFSDDALRVVGSYQERQADGGYLNAKDREAQRRLLK
jgi:hypothetical protein